MILVCSCTIYALAAKNVTRIKIQAPSPTTTPWLNASKEHAPRMLPTGVYRLCFNSIRQLQREADAWLHTYNRRRSSHGDYMAGRLPIDLLELSS
jgi:hypothetical protein